MADFSFMQGGSNPYLQFGFGLPMMGGGSSSIGSSTPLMGSTALTTPTGPGVPAPMNMPSSQGIGFNVPTAQLALSGLGTIGNLWAAFQAQKLAKEQFNYTRGVTETNLTNSIKQYNTSLGDRARNRSLVEGKDYTSWYDENKLNRSK